MKKTLETKLQAFKIVKEFSGEYPSPSNKQDAEYIPYLQMLVDGASTRHILEQFDGDQNPQTLREALLAVANAKHHEIYPIPFPDNKFGPICQRYLDTWGEFSLEEMLEQYQKDQLFQEFLLEAINNADGASLLHMSEAYSRLNPPLELQTFDLSIDVPETNRYHHHIEAHSEKHANMILNDLDFDHTNGYYDVVFGV